MYIITQESDIVNFDKLLRISAFTSDIDNTQTFAIVACNDFSEEPLISDVCILGVYNDITECEEVITALKDSLEKGSPVFVMPEPVVKE